MRFWISIPKTVQLPTLSNVHFGRLNRPDAMIHMFVLDTDGRFIRACGARIPTWDQLIDCHGVIDKTQLCRHCADSLWRHYSWRPAAEQHQP